MISNIITFYINSKYRTSGTTDNFIYVIDNLPADLNYCSVTNITIPKTYYLINENNSTFKLMITDTLTSTTTSYILNFDYGNYDETQFYSALQDLINNAQLDIIFTVEALTLNYDTGKMKISYTENNYDVNLFIYADSDINELMGLDKGDNLFVSKILTSKYIMNLNNENNIYLNWNIVKNDINNGSSANVLCAVYAHDMQYLSFFSQWFDIIANMKKCDHSNNTLTFWLTNEQGRRINLNNIDFSFTLHFFKDNWKLYNKFNDFIN